MNIHEYPREAARSLSTAYVLSPMGCAVEHSEEAVLGFERSLVTLGFLSKAPVFHCELSLLWHKSGPGVK